MYINPVTAVLLWAVGVWFVLVTLVGFIVYRKLMPGIREIMESGTEAEKREVLKAVFPPRFKR